MIEALVKTDEAKCNGCNNCVRKCPIFSANKAVLVNGENKVYINHEACIHCGACVKACSSGARYFVDDTERFLSDLHHGKPISIIVAPAIRTNYIDNYKNVLGYLKSLGVKNIYDVSFGADITTWAYLKHINNGAKSVIAQPCPCVVNYVEKHLPKLLDYLAPVHSPMLCTAIYMKRYLNMQEDLAFISPCIAKKDEVDDPNTKGLVSYNVTLAKLQEYFIKNKIDVNAYPPADFAKTSGLGSLFSKHGGLRENVDFYTNNSTWIKQIEGMDEAYEYLDEFAEKHFNDVYPTLVDILNCDSGCNYGSAVFNTNRQDEADYAQFKAKQDLIGHKDELFELFSQFDRELEPLEFKRLYTAKEEHVPHVTKAELQGVYQSLLKDTKEEQEINCHCCGYATCEAMAEAVYLGYNHIENCIMYVQKQMSVEKQHLEDKNDDIRNMASEVDSAHASMDNLAQTLQQRMDEIHNIFSDFLKENEATVVHVNEVNQQIENNNNNSKKIGELIELMKEDIKGYMHMSKDIVDIAEQINLLAVNAYIEAARAGTAGKTFGVVASQIKDLALQTKISASDAQKLNSSITPKMKEISDFLTILSSSLDETKESIQGVMDTTQRLNGEMTMKADEIDKMSQEIRR